MRYQVPVQLGDRSYTVHIGDKLLAHLGPLTSAALRRQVRRAFIVADARVAPTHLLAAADSLKSVGVEVRSSAVLPSEQDKSLATLTTLLANIARAKLDRDDVIIALGGGIVGDIAGFAASIYRRGIPVVQCPTTLLAMVDASVGGKTGVNLLTSDSATADLKKNLIGAFHQPRLVVADIDTLRLLPQRAFRAGLAECIKHGLLASGPLGADQALLAWTTAAMPELIAISPGPVAELVARNVAVKALAVGRDEREEASEGGRALLNLGHTFGHAIETLPLLHLPTPQRDANTPASERQPANLQHGEAVALGLLAAATCARELNLCSQALVERLRTMLESAGLPTSVGGLPPNAELIERMSHDKKVRGGQLRLVLPLSDSAGNASGAEVVVNPPVAAINTAWDSIRL